MSDRNIIFIAGTGRGGTTWIQDVLARANDYSTAFEPLHPCVGDVACKYSNRWLDKESDEPDLQKYLESVCNGSFRHLWVNYRVRPEALVPSLKVFLSRHEFGSWLQYHKRLLTHYIDSHRGPTEGCIIKFIRANLMLPWLSSHFTKRILLVVRHPCAVIESKLRLGGPLWDPRPLISRYLNDKKLIDCYLADYVDFIKKRAELPAAMHAIIWCIENMVPLSQANQYGYYTVFYEHLVVDAENEWSKLCSGIGLIKQPSGQLLIRPSQQAAEAKDSVPLSNVTVRLSYWMNRLKKSELYEISEVLERFNVLTYSMNSPLPLVK